MYKYIHLVSDNPLIQGFVPFSVGPFFKSNFHTNITQQVMSQLHSYYHNHRNRCGRTLEAAVVLYIGLEAYMIDAGLLLRRYSVM